jgi:hypothetical protein
MDEQQLTALISKTAALMEQFDRRCGDIDGRLQTLAAELERATRQVPAIVRQSADGSLATLPALVMDRMGGGLERPVHDYQQRVRTAGTEIEAAALRLSGQIGRLERLHRLLLWKTVGAVAACLALLLVGGAWLSVHYTRVIRDNQLSAELLRAYNGADVTLCDRGRLCANVDARGHRYGERGQYLPVLPR